MKIDKNVVYPHWCDRCGLQFKDYRVVSECPPCRFASLLMYGSTIQGGMGGE